MVAFPSMIAKEARDAGMLVPDDPDGEWDLQEYLHFNVLCMITLGRPIHFASFRETLKANAKLIAAIELEELKAMTVGDVFVKCYQY
jgi:hypothetical protein